MMTNNLSIGISLTCFKRADYLQEVLDSLKTSINKSNSNFIFYPHIDYNNDKVVDLIKSVDWIPTQYVCNKPPVGCNTNTRNAIQSAIQYHDAIIHLEDDTVLSEDAIDYYIYALNKYQDDPKIISVSGYNKTDYQNTDNYYETFTEQFFCCWGCAFWKSKIDIILNNWTKQLLFMNPQSWDSHLQENLFKNRYSQVRPVISRIQNIGAKNGTYVHDPVWHYYNHRSPYTSNDMKHPVYNSWKDYAENNK